MRTGRPTAYSKEIIDKSKDYLENFADNGDVIPSVEGLAAYIGRARSTLYNWAEDENKKEFLDILESINEKQKRLLINKGLTSEFNSNITKLVLGKHGFSERDREENDTDHIVDKLLRKIADELPD